MMPKLLLDLLLGFGILSALELSSLSESHLDFSAEDDFQQIPVNNLLLVLNMEAVNCD